VLPVETAPRFGDVRPLPAADVVAFPVVAGVTAPVDGVVVDAVADAVDGDADAAGSATRATSMPGIPAMRTTAR
jgi:hypothetical protein